MRKINYSALIYVQDLTIADIIKPKSDIVTIYKNIKKRGIKAGIIRCDKNGNLVRVKRLK